MKTLFVELPHCNAGSATFPWLVNVLSIAEVWPSQGGETTMIRMNGEVIAHEVALPFTKVRAALAQGE